MVEQKVPTVHLQVITNENMQMNSNTTIDSYYMTEIIKVEYNQMHESNLVKRE